MATIESSQYKKVCRDFYDSELQNQLICAFYGGEHIHVGIYENESEPVDTACGRTVKKMASRLNLSSKSRVLDLGSGYGGSARYLAKTYGCHVTCVNLSEVQNQRHRKLNQEVGLDSLISVYEGDFENLPSEIKNNYFDIVWSQEAFLHSGNRSQVFQEVKRVLVTEGQFIFTDIMAHHDCPNDVLQRACRRLDTDSLGSIHSYCEIADKIGLKTVEVIEMSEQFVHHYSRELQALEINEQEIVAAVNELKKQNAIDLGGSDLFENLKTGLEEWIDSGKQGYLTWGILHFQKN